MISFLGLYFNIDFIIDSWSQNYTLCINNIGGGGAPRTPTIAAAVVIIYQTLDYNKRASVYLQLKLDRKKRCSG